MGGGGGFGLGFAAAVAGEEEVKKPNEWTGNRPCRALDEVQCVDPAGFSASTTGRSGVFPPEHGSKLVALPHGHQMRMPTGTAVAGGEPVPLCWYLAGCTTQHGHTFPIGNRIDDK